MSELRELQDRLGYAFGNEELLRQALTHRTWVEEQHPGGNAPAHLSQQRLEFLGDALLNHVVGRWVYDAAPLASEGELTTSRTAFTRGEWLSARGLGLGLGPLVRRGRGEAQNAGLNRTVLEDTTEAILGAVALDGGDEAAARLIRSWLAAHPPTTSGRDPVIVVNDWHQKKHRTAPPRGEYASTGPDHQKTWTGTITVDGVTATGRGASQKEAKRRMMQDLVEKLGIEE